MKKDMSQNARQFQVTDLFGSVVDVEFRWLQNGIAIRHADTVDVKFETRSGDLVEEKVIALPHPSLLQVAQDQQTPLSDSWCMNLAASHLKQMLETGDDLEKTLVTLTAEQIKSAATALRAVPA